MLFGAPPVGSWLFGFQPLPPPPPPLPLELELNLSCKVALSPTQVHTHGPGVLCSVTAGGHL